MQLRVIGALLTVASLTATQAGAQATTTAPVLGLGTHFGAKVGLNRSVLDGQINTKSFFKTGFSGGLLLRFRPSRGFAVQPELLYSQLGAGGSNSPSNPNPDFEYRLNYLAVPLLFKAYIGNCFYLQAGPQVGFLLAGHKVNTGNASTTSNDVTSDYNGVDLAGVGGIGADLPGGLVVSARLAYGLTDINSNDLETKFRQQLGVGGLHNRSFEFSVGYLFRANKD